MRITSLYPLMQVADVEASSTYYETHFGFTRIFSSDWYIQLRAYAVHPFEIAFITQDHDSIPVASQGLTKAMVLSLYVDNAAEESDRLTAAGLDIVQPLRDEVFGQRHLIVRDPDGMLIDIITPIEPDAEFLKTLSA